MKTFAQVMEDFSDAKQKAITFLDQVTLSSRFGTEPDMYVRHVLKPSTYPLTGPDQTGRTALYRGINLNHLDSSAKDALKGLAVGSSVPAEYERPNTGQILIHTTTDQSIAEKYAGDGCFMVFEMMVPNYDIIADTSQLRQSFSDDDFTPDNWKYFDNESEVLVALKAMFSTRILKLGTE